MAVRSVGTAGSYTSESVEEYPPAGLILNRVTPGVFGSHWNVAIPRASVVAVVVCAQVRPNVAFLPRPVKKDRLDDNPHRRLALGIDCLDSHALPGAKREHHLFWQRREFGLTWAVVILEVVEAGLRFEPDHPLNLSIRRDAKQSRAVRARGGMAPERRFVRFDGRAGTGAPVASFTRTVTSRLALRTIRIGSLILSARRRTNEGSRPMRAPPSDSAMSPTGPAGNENER